ncbi:MAG: restriction endonuclease subunit S [Bacteroidetes bacterium]|nr:restriction endonuclease subunit S [Bacteroidota bacterium]
MNKAFKTYKLSELATILAGGDMPDSYSTQKTNFLKIPVFSNGEKENGLYGYTDIPKVTEPAVTISARGSKIGFTALRKEPFLPIVRLISLIPYKEKIDVNFLFYNLKLNRQSGIGSAQPQLTIPEISNRTISVPPLFIQQKIASVLSALDEKIEFNNKINGVLEQMAKTIYDYWFVQFDFPDAKARPYKSSGGKMVWNEELQREVPEGWEVKSLQDFIASDKNGDWGKEESEGKYTTKVECIRGTDINGISGKGELKTPTRYILEKNEGKILSAGDLVIEISGGSPVQSTGRLAYISEEVLNRFENPLICSNFCKAISLKQPNFFFYFIYSWYKAYDHGVFFGFEGKTSGIKNLLFDTLVSNYYIVKPEKTVLNLFQEKVAVFEAKRQKNLLQNQELASLREWLLPMLMNGQVTVGDVSEQIEGILSGAAEENY